MEPGSISIHKMRQTIVPHPFKLPAIALAIFVAAFALPSGNARAETNPARDVVTVDSQTETVIKGALRFLAGKQASNGSWSAAGGKPYPVAMTGYVLMAFLATGNLPDEGEYSKNVAAGMQFLLDSVQPDGIFRGAEGGQYMYNHGIATIALAELYGQTKAQGIRPKLERLVDLIVKSQNSAGGWRYQPRPNDADISVTVLQVVALRAAKNAGLAVPQQTIDDAVKYVRSCYYPATGGFRYQAQGAATGFARTAAAIYSLQVCGQYDDPLVKAGSDYLFAHTNDRQWLTYGLYYAMPAEYMIGGANWSKWYAEIKGQLLKNVKQNGDTASWSSGLEGGGYGAIYYTSVYTNVLAMPYHYIPLYQR